MQQTENREDLLTFSREVHPDGRIWFRRRSQILQVWSLESCLRKVHSAIANQTVKELFDTLSAVLGGYCHGYDPLMSSWFGECFNNMERAYEQICNPPAELPDCEEEFPEREEDLPELEELIELPEAEDELPNVD